MKYLDSDRLEKIISLSPLRGSLNVQVLASTAKDDVKCIFCLIFKIFVFRSVHGNFFGFIFGFIL